MSIVITSLGYLGQPLIISGGYGHIIRRCELIFASQPAKVRISANRKNFQTQTPELSDFKIIGCVIAKLQRL